MTEPQDVPGQANPEPSPYGAQPLPSYGAPQPPSYGAPQPPSYGTPQPPSYGTPQPPSYGTPPPPSYGAQPLPSYGSPNQPYPGRDTAGQLAGDPSLAEWWRRLLGWLIDSAILAVVVGVTVGPFWLHGLTKFARRLRNVKDRFPNLSTPAAHTAISAADKGVLGSFLLLAVIGALIAVAYYWLQYALWGRTIGKRALGTIVVTADSRSKIGAGAAGVRAAVFVLGPGIPLVGPIFWLLDNLWQLWDPRRQCLHDKAAGTVVARHRCPAPLAQAQPGSW
jgi:uncharacterized RDD family membrane protein YckC